MRSDVFTNAITQFKRTPYNALKSIALEQKLIQKIIQNPKTLCSLNCGSNAHFSTLFAHEFSGKEEEQ